MQAKLDQQQALITELEDQMNKKKKNKKKGECLECFKKEAELQTLNNKLMMVS